MKAYIFAIIAIFSLILPFGLQAKELQVTTDPGRVVDTKNTEILIKRIGNTSVYYIGDLATKTCTALTERDSWWWGTNSVAITAMPPEACGFPAKEMKIEVVLPPSSKSPTTTTPVTPSKKVSPTPKASSPCPAVCTAP